jgi:hypothetical protein
LIAFVRSRGYEVGNGKNRTEILSLAREAWDRLKIVRSGIVTPKEVRCSADLDGLSKDGLQTWIQSRGWTRGTTRMKRAELLDLARRIWDNPEIVRQEVRSRADLDRLSNKGLQTWVQSQGWVRSVIDIRKAERLDLARRIWDNSDIAHSTPITPDEVRSHEDLERLSKNGLHTWILSRDYGVTAFKSTSREELLDQAGAVWDHLESFSDDRGARPKDPTAKHKKLNFAAKEIKTPKTRSDLISMNGSELSDWIRSQGFVIQGNQAKKKHLVLELAEKIWDAVKDGKPLPENVRIRTSPRTRSDLSLMLGKDLDLWIRSHNIPIGRGVVDIKKELQSLAEQIWDAIQNGTLASLRKKLRPDKVKVPQTREDLRQMTKTDLMQWIGSQRVCVGKSDKNKDRIWLSLKRHGML